MNADQSGRRFKALEPESEPTKDGSDFYQAVSPEVQARKAVDAIWAAHAVELKAALMKLTENA